jgi:hypothetical protein
MTQTPSAETVRAAIAAYLDGAPESEILLARVARRRDVLPLYCDWSACIALATSGALVWVDYDEPLRMEDAEEREKGRWKAGIRHLAFAVGSNRYPAQEWLKPIRTPDCVTCTECGGTGRPLINGQPAPDNFVCECGGMGWIPGVV